MHQRQYITLYHFTTRFLYLTASKAATNHTVSFLFLFNIYWTKSHGIYLIVTTLEESPPFGFDGDQAGARTTKPKGLQHINNLPHCSDIRVSECNVFFMELGFIFDYIKDDIRSSHRLQEEPGSLACQCDFKYQKKSGTYYIKNLYLRRRHVVSFVYSSEELGGRFE